MKKLITVVVPVHNEMGNLEPLRKEVGVVFGKLKDKYQYKILFVDDGSSDSSVEIMKSMSQSNDEIDFIELSRNFGKEAALTAGLQQAEGDAVIMMDADLQHPPEIIEKFVSEWETGAEVVVGVRERNPDEGLVRKISSAFFSYLMRKTSSVNTTPGATDFRLIDRVVITEFIKLTERERMVRGLVDWLGFKRSYVHFSARTRLTGTAQYSYPKLLKLAISAIVSNSMMPLRLAGYIGLIVTSLSGALGLFILVEQFVLNDPLGLDVTPIALLSIMILFLNGILLICIGLVSLYIEKIYHEAANRPLFIIRKSSKETVRYIHQKE